MVTKHTIRPGFEYMLDHFWRMLSWHQMYSFALTIVRSLHVVGVLTRLVTL